MEPSVQNQIIQVLNAVFSDITIKEEDKAHLVIVKDLISDASVMAKKDFAEILLGIPLPPDNSLALHLFLFDLLQEPQFIDRIFKSLSENLSPALYYDIFWNLSNRSFVGENLGRQYSERLRQYHNIITPQTNAFLDNMGMRTPKKLTSLKNIAIISPQILNMRHSPTREAFSLALHLDQYFGCNTYIFNTNGLNYGNIMNVIEPLNSYNNKELHGGQVLSIDYMNFQQKDVRIMSFDADPMSTRKIATILDTLNQLNIDAVISHGENLLVQEAINGVWPSIFATTGTVVPYAHSDAYFIPGHLYNESNQLLADKYGHTDFMLESMLVTPEGEAEQAQARSEFGIKEDAFIYLVVGTRLNNELTEPFISICQQLIDNDEDCVIAFAGTSNLSLAKHFSQHCIETARVINLKFQNDLPSICKMADVFLNPQRNGGGTSSQTAILNGLPIVTLNVGHISAVVPKELRHENWQSYLAFAQRLKSDSQLYKEWQKKLQDYFIENMSTKNQVGKIHQKLIDIIANKYS